MSDGRRSEFCSVEQTVIVELTCMYSQAANSDEVARDWAIRTIKRRLRKEIGKIEDELQRDNIH